MLEEEGLAREVCNHLKLDRYIPDNRKWEEMIEKIKMETRRYAKRQLTWFRKNKQTIWLEGTNDIQNNINIILEGIGIGRRY